MPAEGPEPAAQSGVAAEPATDAGMDAAAVGTPAPGGGAAPARVDDAGSVPRPEADGGSAVGGSNAEPAVDLSAGGAGAEDDAAAARATPEAGGGAGAATGATRPVGVDSKTCGIPHVWQPPESTAWITVLRGGDGFVTLVNDRIDAQGNVLDGSIDVLGAQGELLHKLGTARFGTPSCPGCRLFSSVRAQRREERVVAVGLVTTSITKGAGTQDMILFTDHATHREPSGYLFAEDALVPILRTGPGILVAKTVNQTSEPEWMPVEAMELSLYDDALSFQKQTLVRTTGYFMIDLVSTEDDRLIVLERRQPPSDWLWDHPGAGRVEAMNASDFTQLASWTAPGDITLSAVAIAASGEIVVIGRQDTADHAIIGVIYRLDGTTLQPVAGSPLVVRELGTLYGVVVAANGDAIVSGAAGLQRYTPAGAAVYAKRVALLQGMIDLAIQSDGSIFASDLTQHAFVYCE